ncbi:MAG: DUF2065 domain-containing protein [Alphaproteobacteria bacterium]|nr:DUF2065 domain-containing protein [Alphaproteobacteria bacterium]
MRQIASWIAVVLVLEGALYALFPRAMKRMMASIMEQPPEVLRLSGLIAALVGVGIAWLVRA